MKLMSPFLILLASCGGAVAPPPPVAVQPPAVAKEERKEVKVDMKKDPLAYKVHQLPAGSIALFEGWKINPLGSQGNWSSFQTFPEGKVDDYSLIIIGGTPDADEMARFFEIFLLDIGISIEPKKAESYAGFILDQVEKRLKQTPLEEF